MKIELKNIEETLLLPLWSRAKISREYSSLFNDTKAIDLVEQIDYDFSRLGENPFQSLLMAARAKQFDDKIRRLLLSTLIRLLLISERGLTQRFTELITG